MRSLPILLIAAVAAMPVPASAQARRPTQARPPAASRPPAPRSQAVRRPPARGPASRPAYRPGSREYNRYAYPYRSSYYRSSYYRPYSYSPYYYPGYRTYVGLSFGWGWGYPYSFLAGYGYPFYGYPAYGYPGVAAANDEYFIAEQNMGAVRIMAKPRQAEVYVDGYYVGIVDDYDGVYQRLRLEPGEHQLLLYLDGYRPTRQTLYFTPGATLKVQYVLEPLGPGEAQEPRPQPPAQPPAAAEPGAPAMPRPGAEVMAQPVLAFGTLVIRAQPSDAEIVIDGDAWTAPIDQDRLVVQVTEGIHQVVIRRAGYETFSAEVEVRRGETAPLNVSLRRE